MHDDGLGYGCSCVILLLTRHVTSRFSASIGKEVLSLPSINVSAGGSLFCRNICWFRRYLSFLDYLSFGDGHCIRHCQFSLDERSVLIGNNDGSLSRTWKWGVMFIHFIEERWLIVAENNCSNRAFLTPREFGSWVIYRTDNVDFWWDGNLIYKNSTLSQHYRCLLTKSFIPPMRPLTTSVVW